MNGVCCRCFPSEAAAEQVIFFSTTSDFSPELAQALQDSPGYLDAFLHAAVRTTKPFLWTDISDILEPRSPQLRHYKEKIAGLGTGVVVPVFAAVAKLMKPYIMLAQEELAAKNKPAGKKQKAA